MIGQVTLLVGDTYILDRYPLKNVDLNYFFKDLVHDGEIVNVYECSELEKFYKIESLDHKRTGYILKSCIKICELGKDIGFSP